jgi:hypothetical protein
MTTGTGIFLSALVYILWPLALVLVVLAIYFIFLGLAWLENRWIEFKRRKQTKIKMKGLK